MDLSTGGLTSPVSGRNRIDVLDILRGFALLGIFVVNIEIMNCVFMNQDGFSQQWTGRMDGLAVRILQLFFYSKFFPIFSFLFGLGISMQALKRREAGHGGTAFLVRRMIALFVIGVLHVVFLWGGDVLHLYAILGLMTMFVLRLPAWSILLSSVVVLFFPYYEAISTYIFQLTGFQPEVYLSAYTGEEVVRIIREGTYVEGMVFRMDEYMANTPLLFFFLGPVAFSMFLVGLYFGKKKLVYNLENFLTKSKWYMLGLAIVTNTYRLWFLFLFPDSSVHGNAEWAPLIYQAMYYSDVLLGLFYLWGVAWLMRYGLMRKVLRPLRFAGRMALTNYLMQSLIGMILFSGLGLYQTLSPWQTLVVAFAVFIFQVVFSKFWLTYFRYGPAEYIWRAVSYRKWPDMRVHPAQSEKQVA